MPWPPLGRIWAASRQARGIYSVRVSHTTFEDGPLAVGERRRGCVSYSQLRRFSIVSRNAGNSSLYVRVYPTVHVPGTSYFRLGQGVGGPLCASPAAPR